MINLITAAFQRNGGNDNVRRRRRAVVNLAYHRSTTAYVTREAKESRYARDQLNIAKEQYNNLINKDLIENLQMTALQVYEKMDEFMRGATPGWEVQGPTKVHKPKPQVERDNTGLAYNAETDAPPPPPVKVCQICKDNGRPEKVYKSHTTDNHKPGGRRKDELKAEDTSKDQPASGTKDETNTSEDKKTTK